MADQTFIPFHRPSLGREENEAVLRVLASNWLTTGPVAQQFERDFAAYVGCKHALAVNSGTAALQLALDAIGLHSGDEVLLPSYTFTATAEVVTYFGARPVLCDSVPGAFNLDPMDAERRITERTRAIIPVHIAGQPCDMDAIGALAARHNLHVIEDAAHALPAGYKGKRIGTLSELTAFSFYATKTITTGEGGMLATDNEEYARRSALMRLHGISGEAWKRYSKEGSWFYEVQEAGYKLNMPDLLAAVGCAQLAKADLFRERRYRIAQRYTEGFSAMDELQVPPQAEDPNGHSWHLYILRLQPQLLSISRNEFIEKLKEHGVGSSVHFIPLHLHPFYGREFHYQRSDFPWAENAYERCVSLPIFPDMTAEEIERVVHAVKSVIAGARHSRVVAA